MTLRHLTSAFALLILTTGASSPAGAQDSQANPAQTGPAQAAPAADAAPVKDLKPAAIAPLAAQSLILDAALAGNRLVAVGERGHILLSDDAGKSWRQVPSPANTTLTGVSFADAKQGWAVGHDAVILHTTDGGETWELQHYAPELEQPLMDVHFGDPMNGIAVGAYALFMETSDGGRTWTDRRIIEDDYHFNAVFAPTPETRVIAGEFGGVYVSADRGKSFAPVETPYEGSFFGGLALGPQSFLVFGLQGNAFRTDDNGKSWSQIQTNTKSGLMGGAALKDGRTILVGPSGTVLTSTDGARTFSLERRSDRVALAEAIEAPDGTLILLGEQGAITTAAAPAGAPPGTR
ncbi:MAG TPA: YCF48-related protein [Azospirillaceae bacterium]|nr:YCF48-related protein [Azospirillaceae bacterium]